MPKDFRQVDNLVLIYTGDGKGKTTAALGLTTRALREGWKVLMVQFIKSSKGSGEVGLKKILPRLEVKCFGKGFIIKKQDNKITRKQNVDLALRGLKFVTRAIDSGKYNVIILDEIFVAHTLKLLRLSDIIKLVRDFKCQSVRDKNSFLVLTGRGCPKSLYKYADLVTEMKEVKHPFKKGIKAIKGIDF